MAKVFKSEVCINFLPLGYRKGDPVEKLLKCGICARNSSCDSPKKRSPDFNGRNSYPHRMDTSALRGDAGAADEFSFRPRGSSRRDKDSQ